MHRATEQTDTGMEMRDLRADREFRLRRKVHHRLKSDAEAFLRLAHVFAAEPARILQELCDIAVEYCGADSSGISLEETDESGELHFRWIAISGTFAHFLNGTTPRFFSPCGTTLNRGCAQLYRVTQRYYDCLGIQAEPITDGILIPWITDGMRGTLWTVSHRSREAFDFSHYKLLEGLADFASIAIRHQVQQEELRKQERAAAYVEVANRLAHELNNPLQSLTSAIYLLEHGRPEDTRQFIQVVCSELIRISKIVKKLLSLKESA